MNKHFEDAVYYQKRAAEHAKLGVEESLAPAAARVRRLLGREPEADPEPSRIEGVRERVRTVERRAEGGARETLGTARRRFETRRATA